MTTAANTNQPQSINAVQAIQDELNKFDAEFGELRQEIVGRLEAAKKEAFDDARQMIKNLMNQTGLSVNDLDGVAVRRKKDGTPRKSSGPVAAKYAHPESGKTWSGRGRRPAWLGENPEDFRIGK